MRFLCLLFLVGSLSSCTVHRTMVPTGGSRADGTVIMSYELTEFQRAKFTPGQGYEDAKKRCEAWGYTDTEAFGGTTKTCSRTAAFGSCNKWRYDMTFQCLGKPEATPED